MARESNVDKVARMTALHSKQRGRLSKRTKRMISRTLLAATRVPQIAQRAQIVTSSVVLKKKQEKKKTTQVPAAVKLADNPIVQESAKEIDRLEKLLAEELSRHFSLQVDIRQFEDLIVKLDNGTEQKMSHIARVTLKSPVLVVISFTENPAVMKAAKLAIQKSSLNVTPQQEGATFYIRIPPMSREHREQKAADAKGKILNEYKKALNEVYKSFDKKSTTHFASKPDEAKKTREQLLELKHLAETRGSQFIDSKRKELLTQTT